MGRWVSLHKLTTGIPQSVASVLNVREHALKTLTLIEKRAYRRDRLMRSVAAC